MAVCFSFISMKLKVHIKPHLFYPLERRKKKPNLFVPILEVQPLGLKRECI